jgi:hypothetical protein
MQRGKNTGGDAIKWFMPGAEAVYARFYVKFSADHRYVHHFVSLGATQATNKWSAFGKAGLKPDGTYYSAGMKPWFAWGNIPSPGELNLYTYYLDMQPDTADGKQAMWVDGKLVGEFTGIRWRTDLDLKANCLWLEHYGYDGGDPTKAYWKDKQTVWFDDIVVATRYVGPIAP